MLDQSVKKVIEVLEGTDADFADLVGQEKAGDNRKTLVEWLESQIPEELEEEVKEVKSVKPAPVEVKDAIDTVEGGEWAIVDLISVLSQRRDHWQRKASCGLENIRVHLSEIKITVR